MIFTHKKREKKNRKQIQLSYPSSVAVSFRQALNRCSLNYQKSYVNMLIQNMLVFLVVLVLDRFYSLSYRTAYRPTSLNECNLAKFSDWFFQ